MPKLKNQNRKKEIKILEKLLEIIYPPMCSICGAPSKQYLCNKCEKKLNQIEIIPSNVHLVSDTKMTKCIHAFMYEGVIRDLILQYKFDYKPYIYRTFITFFKKNEKLYSIFRNYDIIVPVPISKKRWKNRGYNQSALLAKELAKIYNLKYDDTALIKIKNNPKQSTLNQEERIQNVKNVYKIKNNVNIINKNILLVDDVYTTGATCGECAKILEESGAKFVGVFTIAKD